MATRSLRRKLQTLNVADTNGIQNQETDTVLETAISATPVGTDTNGTNDMQTALALIQREYNERDFNSPIVPSEDVIADAICRVKNSAIGGMIEYGAMIRKFMGQFDNNDAREAAEKRIISRCAERGANVKAIELQAACKLHWLSVEFPNVAKLNNVRHAESLCNLVKIKDGELCHAWTNEHTRDTVDQFIDSVVFRTGEFHASKVVGDAAAKKVSRFARRMAGHVKAVGVSEEAYEAMQSKKEEERKAEQAKEASLDGVKERFASFPAEQILGMFVGYSLANAAKFTDEHLNQLQFIVSAELAKRAK